MFERILVPLDTSKTAESVLPYAVEITGKFGSRLYLVTVSEPVSAQTKRFCQTYLEHVTEQVRVSLKKKGASEGLGVQNEVLIGKAGAELLRYADVNDVSLIIMARHGSSGQGPWFLGSIADKVLRATKQSVLLVREPLSDSALRRRQLVRRVLIPLDGSRTAETAIPVAEELSLALGARLVLLTVVVPSSLQRDSFEGFMDSTLEELTTEAEIGQEERKTSAAKYLETVTQPLMEKGCALSSVVLMGSPPEQIIDYAVHNRIDLICMSSHGRTGISRWVFGSVTDKVLHTGGTPVLVVRARKT